MSLDRGVVETDQGPVEIEPDAYLWVKLAFPKTQTQGEYKIAMTLRDVHQMWAFADALFAGRKNKERME